MCDRGLLGAGGHAERPEEACDQTRKLAIVLLLTLHHGEHDRVSLAHALCMGRSDVQLHDLFPSSSTQPATEEALHLFVEMLWL